MPAYDAITESLRTQSAPPVRPIAATDGELLMRFTRHADEGAFAELVDRHAALVWSVCRQVLRNEADVEDAFQATFLILARRAKTIRASDSAAAWLYRVAHRTAISQWRRQRRRNEEPLNGYDPVGDDDDPLEKLDRQHLVTVLVEELRALPEKYQTPLVLCYLEGQSRSAAAEALDCTTAAIKGRLARGRRMLRSRLARRGVALSVASAAAATAVSTAEATVAPMSLGPATATAATSFVTGGAPSAATPVCTLAQEGASTMFYASLAKPMLSVAAVLVVGVATAVAVQEESPRAATAGSLAGSPTLLLVDSPIAEASDAPNVTAPVVIGPSTNVSAPLAAPVAPVRPVIGPMVEVELHGQQTLRVPTANFVANSTAFAVPAPPLISHASASIEQLAMERKHWELRAKGLRMKALAKNKRFERLKTLEKETPGSVSAKDLADLEEELADAMLLSADAYMAQAKQLELDQRIKQLQRMQQLQSRSWEQPTQPTRHQNTRYEAAAPTPAVREVPLNSLPSAILNQQFDRPAQPPVVVQPYVAPPATASSFDAPPRAPNSPIYAPTSPSRRPDLVPADPNTVVNVLVKDLRLMKEKIKALEKSLAEKEADQEPTPE